MPDFKGLSPIFRHALESFEHGIFHYLDGTILGQKFSLLHIDHAIELLLKEKVVRLGHSIYKKDGKTISIYEAFGILENNKVIFAEKPRLEELHDFRNVVQHKGLTPDRHTTEFYITEAYKFVKRFLSDELAVKLENYLPSKYVKVLEGIEDQESGIRKMLDEWFADAEKIFQSESYEMAVLTAFIGVETLIRNKFNNDRSTPAPRLLKQFVVENKISEDVLQNFMTVNDLRNRLVHTAHRITREEAEETLELLSGIRKILSE